MKRSDKELHLSKVEGLFSKFKYFIIANFQGMVANDFFSLRKELKMANSGLMVVKNSLSRIALKKMGREELSAKFFGSIFIVYSDDIILISKILAKFMKDNKSKISLLCAYDSNEILDSEKVLYFASLPSLRELHAQIMSMISYNIPVRLALCLKALGNKE
ncbi:50S ribosomal protein L10 [Ehrlichia canis]|uniref:Large ribosomal subunit protein uL10 n=1 Tax=Ehrlichia canis (strain Jake) TaxID=269484 RepID=RL10_EHRCJ|nr:50S ribosomal protein L10 [Ehrlichia canis]Q3YST7.1 RecName: Full=Large ribosomal subunit protein uL10; AltName: Full=50S ribosomal protein L10 [Ehrlichia canis str. Jake]AAZ68218.1 LSU ribosomal protein L10P [Ehrlichia canis str. Jake]AUO55017.1 50S ribosomal protein L10 [Ehrlichia canis]UKC53682.1 50S ribosomal protein L10 [Ehrlichia canis]UKC54620.1 50S ribosomal protein L10 [Ehrlichia canis]UKC55556.1 50S ribosomal protein L10 [Ehrlichia canis]